MSKLVVNTLVKSYNRRKVVDSVCLNVPEGRVVGLLGPNGAGKSTTFNMIVGFIKPDHGFVFMNDVDITNYPTNLRVIKGLGYLPQDPSVFLKLTVEQNLMIVLDFLSLTKYEKQNRAYSLLDELGILNLASRRVSVLSGGERRRLEIARSLIMNPKFMLLDEPFAGVDPIAVIDIVNIINHLKKRNIGVMISDHNVRETLDVCDIAYILNEGIVVESGSSEKIIKSKIARKLYLGDKFKI